jgi:hypothetical protein
VQNLMGTNSAGALVKLTTAALASDAQAKATAAQAAAIAASAPASHVGQGGGAHALVTALSPGFMSPAQSNTLSLLADQAGAGSNVVSTAARDGYSAPWDIVDINSLQLFRVDAEGVVGVTGMRQLGDPLPARDGHPWSFFVSTPSDQLLIGVAVHDGVMHTGGLQTAEMPNTNPRDGDTAIARMTTNDSGASFLEFDPMGRLDAAPSPAFLGRVYEAQQALRTLWRGGDFVTNIAANALGLVGDVTDGDGFSAPALQLHRGGYGLPTSVALPIDNVFEIVVGVGQSNMGDGAVANSASLGVTAYRHHVLAPSGAAGDVISTYGADAPFTVDNRADFGPARHSVGFDISWTLASLDAFIGMRRRAGLGHGTFGHVAMWRGSTVTNDFLAGKAFALFENTQRLVENMTASARRYGMVPEVRTIYWAQGEAGAGSGLNMYVELWQVIQDYRAMVRAVTGQTYDPEFLILQTSQNSLGVGNPADSDAQRFQAQTRAGVRMVGPSYHLPFFNQGATNIHYNDTGKLMAADLAALFRDNPSIEALGVSAVYARSGATVTITFSNMPGVGGLLVDADWVPNVANLGFRVLAANYVTVLAISSVAVTAANVITITLAADPGAQVVVQYGSFTSNPQSTWSGGRGLIYQSSGVPAQMSKAIAGTPAVIRHYLIRLFEITPT